MSNYKWLLDSIRKHDQVVSINEINNDTIEVMCENGNIVIAKFISVQKVFVKDIQDVITGIIPNFIINIPKEAVVNGDVYTYLDNKEISFGGVGDFYRALNQREIWPYYEPESNFIIRGLKQHTKVKNINRLDNKRYEVVRYGLPPVVFIAINDYDLGGESIRNAKDVYKDFQTVLASNPNVRYSQDAIDIAKSINVNIARWRNLLAQLNH